MRLTYLDILEQCFHDKFRGYDKKEVDTFLHLVADDFKEMKDEIEQLQAELRLRDQKIQQMAQSNGNGNASTESKIPSTEALKEKAKQIVNQAREQAEKHLDTADRELSVLKKEIIKLQKEKSLLIENIKSRARTYFQSGDTSGEAVKNHDPANHEA